MSEEVRVTLEPMGKSVKVPHGTPLREVLFEYGIEFPCGGRGRCRGCRVRVLEGSAPMEDSEREILSKDDLDQGWRLACRLSASADLTILAQQWDMPILGDNIAVPFTPRTGLGLAVDIGTTTVVAQLVDLNTGQVLAVKSALNPQARHGGDVMSRVEYAMSGGGASELCTLIRSCVKRLAFECTELVECSVSDVRTIVLVGNTVMHHLFCDRDITPLSRYPFESTNGGPCRFQPTDLGWWQSECDIIFLPCLGGFVGSDILAGILATGIAQSGEHTALVDIGTNGEIVVGDRNGLFCAGTAAGPAFEGARISQGMRAATGAISRVRVSDGELQCEVIGGGKARGICGSGLVDAVAACLRTQRISAIGRLQSGEESIALCGSVVLTQTDIRQLQLAKGAISAGLRILSRHTGAPPKSLHLAGAFGNYVDIESAKAIGLLTDEPFRYIPAGNTALRGAKIAMLQQNPLAICDTVLPLVSHQSLSADAEFQNIYVEEMSFPEAGEVPA